MVQFGLASLRPCGRRRARVAVGSFLLLLGSTLGQTGAPPSAAPAADPGEFSGIPWESLENPAAGARGGSPRGHHRIPHRPAEGAPGDRR